ncbi:potassium voltage-gated channel protein Shaw-like X2, partial [Biomphalaria pfeifferi]
RAPRTVGSLRGSGEARAGLLADQRAGDQGLLLETLPLLHRKPAHPQLFQPQSPQPGRGHRSQRSDWVEEDSVDGLAYPGVPTNIKISH